MYRQRIYHGKDGSEIIVRLATPEDYDETIITYTEVAAERIYINTERPRPDIKQVWTERWVNNGDKILFAIAQLEDKIVGGIVLNVYSNSPKTDHVREQGMWILKDYRGNGVGNALMDYTIQWAKETETVRKITLGVWSPNLKALSLYAQVGFHIDGCHVNMAKINGLFVDEILMSLDL